MTSARILVGSTLSPLRVGPITPGSVRAFAEATGDRNPIHLDAESARRFGLKAPPVYGMQLVAFLHAAAERWRPGIRVESLSTRFLAPISVGDTIEISGRVVKVDEGPCEISAVVRLFLRSGGGDLASVGEARIVLEATADEAR
jgi:acyl dehydratase